MGTMKKQKQTALNKWKVLIGCPAHFNSKGILHIFKNGKVVKLFANRTEILTTYMLVDFDRSYLYLTSDGFTLFRVYKKYSKII